ncbi:hypothetical protein CPLU01_08051 [Colletotrichum plurivorum]|uniref:Integral membrane protein n=1 Tax=Colletotrichum plurivorum TaxID=2175906 RepID=A0A8H6KCU2_9PEZI|nr:hypothetical protein CPLU01_08051 [Colletotrichum plurivorum]
MLTVVALLFFTFTLFHVHTRANRSDRGRHSCATNPICAALRGTIEDVFDATLVFSLALHVATLDFRSRGATRSDVLYAESLCTFVGLACLTMWHMRASVSREKWTTRAAFWGMCALNVAVYVLRQLPHKQPLDLYRPLCETGTEEAGLWFLEPFAMVYWVTCLAMAMLPLRGMFEWARGRPLAHSEVTRWRMWQAFWGVGAMIVHIFMLGSTRNKHLATQSWGIGQYLAVATWLPALLKMGYIVNGEYISSSGFWNACRGLDIDVEQIVGAEVGLTASLPRPWIALLLDDDPESRQSTPSASMRIWSRGVSLMGLPASGFSSWRRRSSKSDNFVDQDTQSSGITQTADEFEGKKVASLQETNTEQCENIRKEEMTKVSPRRRDTDDTLVEDEFEEDEVCSNTSKKAKDQDEMWDYEGKDYQLFEEPEEVDEK